MISVRPAVLCVDLGGTSTKAGVLDGSGELQLVDSIPSQPEAEGFCENLLDLIERTRSAAAANAIQLSGMGVAVAGFLDPLRTHLFYNPNLSWLEGFPLKRMLSERFDMRIELEVDSNAACMAEYRFGGGMGSNRFLCLVSGTGLGVGMSIAGEPLRFAYGCMGDAGHIIVQRDGPLCTCGGRGCAEILVSAPAIAARYRERLSISSAVTLRTVIEAARAGESVAIGVLGQAGEWLGAAIASLANTFFPDRIALAGGLSAAGDLVMKPAERVFFECAASFARSKATFTQARLGSMATLIGAAWPFWAESRSDIFSVANSDGKSGTRPA